MQYAAAEVNAAARRLMESLDGAITSDKKRVLNGGKTYPKASSGFRASEANRDPALKLKKNTIIR